MITHSALIDGAPVDAEQELEVEDPSTGEPFAVVPECGPEEVAHAVAAARGVNDDWRRRPVTDRAAILRRLGELIARDHETLARTECQQTGKPLSQAKRDVELTQRYFDFYASAIETFGGTTIPLNDGTHVFTRWEPHGVTAHIIPWNYPLQILGRSVAPALAMGNTVVLKPAEEAPLTALAVAALGLEAGLPSGAFNVVTGRGEITGAALSSNRGIDHISFTGSVEVGRLISHAAAETLIPVTMELGGKSPNIVFADADLDRAVPVIANSILQCAGQTCSAGSRLLVAEPVAHALVERLVALFEGLRIGAAIDDPDLGPLITAGQRDRVLEYLELARHDARVRTGGGVPSGEQFDRGFFVQPTIIDEVDPTGRLGQEEIFGPVLAVTRFSSEKEAVSLANGTDFGLVAAVWTRDVGRAHRMIRDVTAGQVFVNTYGASGGVELPFGGFKRSGHGREKGLEGLRGFGQIKTGVISLG